jgi:hypothetical protein
MGAQGADDDDTGAQDADGMDMGATTMGVATMGAATMDADTMGATMDAATMGAATMGAATMGAATMGAATMDAATMDADTMDMGSRGKDMGARGDLTTPEEQKEYINKSRRGQGLPPEVQGLSNNRKRSRVGGGITQQECDDITKMNINEAMIVGSDEVMPFITSVVSEYDPVYYYQAIEKQEEYLNKIYHGIDATNKTLEGQWDKKIDIQQSIIDGFDPTIVAAAAAAADGPITIDYNKFITYLITTIDNIAIENVYAGLSVGFNAYMYSYLQDKCNTSTNNMTILEALGCLPNAMKLLIFITNLVEDETGLFFYGEKYGNQEEVSEVIFKLHTPTASPGPIADISNTIDYIYTLDDLHEVYCYVIQFFGIAKKYFIDRSDTEELVITEYFSVSKESTSLIAQLTTGSTTNLDKLDIIISNFLVAVMKAPVDAIQQPNKKSRGGSKTRRKRRPPKKRNMKTKRSNANTKKNKKHNSRKLKKRNRKKRTTRRKK